MKQDKENQQKLSKTFQNLIKLVSKLVDSCLRTKWFNNQLVTRWPYWRIQYTLKKVTIDKVKYSLYNSAVNIRYLMIESILNDFWRNRQTQRKQTNET